MTQRKFSASTDSATFDEDFWETLETLSNQGIDIGQRAARNLTKTRKSKKQGLRAPKNLEDFR